MELMTLYDLTVALGLVWLAWTSLGARNVFVGVVLFVIFGLLMALAWVRLNAPDIALAEAAISSGLTGALMMGALRGFVPDRKEDAPGGRAGLRTISALLAIVLGVLLVVCVVGMPRVTEGLWSLMREQPAAHDVGNMVTSVVLNVRAYDTLLEIGVLLLALLGVAVFYPTLTLSADAGDEDEDPILMALVRVFTPVIVLLAGFMIWVGTDHPGGAFQAGALVAALCVILLLSRVAGPLSLARPFWRILAVSGFVVFIVAGGVCLAGGHFLQYPRALTKSILLGIEFTATLSIALTLGVIFAACANMFVEADDGRMEER